MRQFRRVFVVEHAGNQLAKRMAVPSAQATPVAIVMTSFDAGGTERQMLELARRLDRTRWQVHLACLHARGDWRDTAAAIAPVAEFPITGFGRPDAYRQGLAFARWCVRHRIEVVHTCDLYTNIFALPAAAFARVPVRIGSRRGMNTDRTSAQLAMQRAAYGCAHAIVSNSQAMAARLRAERVRADKVSVIANGIDVQAFATVPARGSRRNVLTVANLRPEKGYDVLVDAAALVLQRFPDAHFSCIGTGPATSLVETRIEERGVAHAFTFLGHRHDVAQHLSEAHLFALPSRSESLPNSVMEAMAAGLPIVASAVGGIPELIDDGRTGLLCAAGDAAALADRLMRIMDDATLANELGRAARRDAETRFSFDRMVSAIDSLYRRELAVRGRTRAEMAA